MRNRFSGVCYRCGRTVQKGEGHVERHNAGWRLQHATCATEARRQKNERQTR